MREYGFYQLDVTKVSTPVHKIYFLCRAGGLILMLVMLFVVVALLFYVHGKHLRSCRDGQLT